MSRGFLSRPPATVSSCTGHVMALEGLDDRPRAECGRFDQRPVDVFGTGAQRHADEHSAELVIDEHRAVAAVPVERDETVLTDVLGARQLGEVAMDVETPTLGFDVVGRRNLLLDEPAEDVSDAALPGFVPEEARGDAAVDDAAHTGHLGQAIAVHDVARGRPHHRQHVAGLDRPRGRRRDVRIHVAHRDRDPLVQPRPTGRLRRETPGAGTELSQRVVELLSDEPGETVVQRAEIAL